MFSFISECTDACSRVMDFRFFFIGLFICSTRSIALMKLNSKKWTVYGLVNTNNRKVQRRKEMGGFAYIDDAIFYTFLDASIFSRSGAN